MPGAIYTTNLPLTELDALNVILSVGGISPITTSSDHASATQQDVLVADDLMRANITAVQAHGWKFNKEFSHRVGVDSCQEFLVPTCLVSFELTARPDQQGPWVEEPTTGGYETAPTRLDLIIQGGLTVDTCQLFYDRLMKITSFGTTATTTVGGSRDQIFVDMTYARDFEDCPESFRTFVTMLSARQFAQRVVGDVEAAGWTEQDLAAAYRELEDEQGDEEPLNVFDNYDVVRMLGGRPRGGIHPGSIRYT